MKVFAHDSRSISIDWASDRFIVRLMYGNRYLTPKLTMTPLDLYMLMDHKILQLDKWFKLIRKNSTDLQVLPTETFVYGLFEHKQEVSPTWPIVSFNLFYAACESVRGCKPENGWNVEYEREVEARRDSWA